MVGDASVSVDGGDSDNVRHIQRTDVRARVAGDASASVDGGDSDYARHIEQAREAVFRGDTDIDIDGDGKREYHRDYGANGRLIREAFDLNFNGRPEIVWDHVAQMHWRDMNEDGKPEVMEFFSTEGATTTRIVAKDKDQDGRPEEKWTYTSKSGEEKIEVTLELDNDADGTFDGKARWEANAAQDSESGLRNPVISECSPPDEAEPQSCSEIGKCTRGQAAFLTGSYDYVMDEGRNALDRLGSVNGYESLLAEFGRTTMQFIVLRCKQSSSSICARASVYEAIVADESTNTMALPIDVFYIGTRFACDGTSLETVLFHEIMHYVLGPGGSPFKVPTP